MISEVHTCLLGREAGADKHVSHHLLSVHREERGACMAQMVLQGLLQLRGMVGPVPVHHGLQQLARQPKKKVLLEHS